VSRLSGKTVKRLQRLEREINQHLTGGIIPFWHDRARDTKHGGWYWLTKPNGSRSDMAKIVYGESFAIYAMAEYTLGTGDKRGLDYASRTFDLLQKHAADTHMHLMESFTTLYEASGLPLHRRKLMEVMDLICAHMIDARRGPETVRSASSEAGR